MIITYKVNSPQDQCTDSYVLETARRLKERILDHSPREKHSACLGHSKNTGHSYINNDNFIFFSNHVNLRRIVH